MRSSLGISCGQDSPAVVRYSSSTDFGNRPSPATRRKLFFLYGGAAEVRRGLGLLVAALAVAVSGCGGGSAEGAGVAPHVHKNASGTVSFTPAGLTINGIRSWSSVIVSDSDPAATFTSYTIGDTSIVPIVVGGYAVTGGYYFMIPSDDRFAGSTTVTFNFSNGDSGTLPVNVVSSPIGFVLNYELNFYETKWQQQIGVIENAAVTFTATSSDTGVVTVVPAPYSPSLARKNHAPPLRLPAHRSGGKHGHDGPVTLQYYTVTSVGFGPATITISDGQGNSTVAPVFVSTPNTMTILGDLTDFTNVGQQKFFQVQEVGTKTFTATVDDPTVVKIVGVTPMARKRTFAGQTLTTVRYTVEAEGITSWGKGSGIITVSDGSSTQPVDYAIQNVIGLSTGELDFAAAGAQYAQGFEAFETNDIDGTFTAQSSDPDAATVTPSSNGYPYEFTVTPVAPPADKQPITITVSDGRGHTASVKVTVTTSGGTVSLKGAR